MAINHRRGKIGDFDPNKMTTAEWAFPDDGTARYCVAPGNVKTVATKEELQEILTSSPEAYQALLQLIDDLEDNPSELTNILNNITNLQDNVGDLSILATETKTNLVGAINEIMGGKFNISDLVHTDTISDMKKAPSTVVTFALGQEIDAINNNLANIKVIINNQKVVASSQVDINILPTQIYLVMSTHAGALDNMRSAYLVFGAPADHGGVVTPILQSVHIEITFANGVMTITNKHAVVACYVSVIRVV